MKKTINYLVQLNSTFLILSRIIALNSRRQVVLITALLINSLIILNAQNDQSLTPSIPSSPQAEAIKRFGEFGISYFTGVPEISIPLYEINHRGYSLPFTLKYNPQPLKPGYNYDVFGNGWGLSVNSCISRIIEYIPDEQKNFKLDTHVLDYVYKNYSGDLMRNNWAHDKFSATLPDGSSFDFIITYNPSTNKIEYIVSSGRSIKISCNYNTSNIYSFTVIDENGVKYTFDGADTPYNGVDVYLRSFFVSWHLTRIDLPHAPYDPILFSYHHVIESNIGDYLREGTSTLRHENNLPVYKNTTTGYIPYYYRMKLLSSINYGSTNIHFEFTNTAQVASRNQVSKIKITDGGNIIKEISLMMSQAGLYYPGSNDNKISQLNGLQITGSQSNIDPEIFSFTYTNSSFNFTGTDHWGFLNSGNVGYDIAWLNLFVEFDPAEHNGLGGMAATQLEKSAEDLSPYYKIRLTKNSTSDNRLPSSPSSHGILSTIHYPTGGYTRFEFENHRCLTRTDRNGNYIHDISKRRMMETGGFRIRKITNYTSENSVADAKCFRYGKLLNVNEYFPDGNPYILQPYTDTHTGLGVSFVDPNILTYMSFTHHNIPTSIPFMITGLSPRGLYESFLNPFEEPPTIWKRWECSFSSSNFRRLLNGRPPVVYPEVTVYHGDIDTGYGVDKVIAGKTLYRYNLKYRIDQGTDTVYVESPEYYGNTLSYVSEKYLYNLLDRKIDYVYTEGGFLMKKLETYSWSHAGDLTYDYVYTNPDRESINVNSTIHSLFSMKRHYTGRALLIGKSMITYDNTPWNFETYGSYQYNMRNQIVRKQSSNSLGNEIITTIQYPESSDTSPTVLSMVDKNMINSILSEEKKCSYPNFIYSSGYKIDYEEFPAGNTSIIMPSKLYQLKNNTTDFVLREEVVKYDAFGNPIEVIGKDNVHTVFLRSYHSRYIVAIIKDATFDQVSTAVQNHFGVTIDAFSAQSQPDTLKLHSFGNQASLSKALVTTFTYAPLVGMTSKTDPNGLTTYYGYDHSGRLESVTDHSGKTVEIYDYHYLNQ